MVLQLDDTSYQGVLPYAVTCAGDLARKLSSSSSLGNMEESYFLQASLGSSESLSDRRIAGDVAMSPYYMKSMTSSSFEAALRQKEGELASYVSRLVCHFNTLELLHSYMSPYCIVYTYIILYKKHLVFVLSLKVTVWFLTIQPLSVGPVVLKVCTIEFLLTTVKNFIQVKD